MSASTEHLVSIGFRDATLHVQLFSEFTAQLHVQSRAASLWVSVQDSEHTSILKLGCVRSGVDTDTRSLTGDQLCICKELNTSLNTLTAHR